MHKVSVMLVALLFCISCGNNDGQQKGISDADVITKEGFAIDYATEHGEYVRYTGTIAGQPVVLNMVTLGDNMTARYYYEQIGVNIALYKNVDSTLAAGEISFAEYPPESTDEPARWRIKISGDSISGIWENFSKTRSFPIMLTKDRNADVQQFTVVRIEDTLRLIDSLPEPLAHFSYQSLIPKGEDEHSSFVRAMIYSSMGCDTIGQNGFGGCMQALKQKYFEFYATLREDFDTDEMGASFNNWSQDITYDVLYNDKGYVVIDNGLYEYTGGAHGNYGSEYLNIDRTSHKLLKLEDIMTVDTAAILPLIEKEVRKRFELGKKDKLSSRLFSEDLYIPESFYLGNKGITFVYGLYEIASYADGMIMIFVPYNKMTDLLKPDFKQRMGLEAVALKS